MITTVDRTYGVARYEGAGESAIGKDRIAGDAVWRDELVDDAEAGNRTDRSGRTLGGGGEYDKGNTDE